MIRFTHLTSMHMILVTTVGFGDVSPQRDVERLYAIVAMFLGAILCDAGLTAILTALIDSLDSKAGENVALSECFKQYMTYRQYPVHLRQRIQNYLLVRLSTLINR